MHHSLRSKYLTMESELDRLLKDLSDYPDETLIQRPAANAWSVMDVMQHLIAVEKGSLAYVKKKASFPDHLKKADWKVPFRNLVLKFFLYAPFKFKAPAVVDETKFDQEADFEELVEQWRDCRQEMMEYLENFPDELLDKLVYRHAIAGRLTIEGMLLFMRDHFVRHRRQIDRTLSQVTA